MKTHPKEPSKFKCELCNSYYFSKMELSRHIRNHHESKAQHGANLQAIKNNKVGDKYKCLKCCGLYTDVRAAKRHMDNRHPAGSSKFKSVGCLAFFKTENGRDYHDQKHHSKEHYKEKDMDRDEVAGGYRCGKCCSIFKTQSGLSLHMKRHPDENTSSTDKHLCNFCPGEFTNSSSLTRHISQWHSEYPCSLCDFKGSSYKDIDDHKKTHQNEDQSEKMTQPEIRLTNNENPGKIQCPKCCVIACSQYVLKKHMASHAADGQVGYPCSHCQGVFKDKINLRRHRRNQHTGKIHACSICHYKTRISLDFTKHMKLHTGYENGTISCKIPDCNARFLKPISLSHHMVAHHKGKYRTMDGQKTIYNCSNIKCNFTTSNKNDLKAHEPMHGRAGIYKCSECDAGFDHYLPRNNHKRSCH